MIRPLCRHPLRRELSQFVVHQRQQFRSGARVAMLEVVQDAGHLVHRTRKSPVMYTQLLTITCRDGAWCAAAVASRAFARVWGKFGAKRAPETVRNQFQNSS